MRWWRVPPASFRTLQQSAEQTFHLQEDGTAPTGQDREWSGGVAEVMKRVDRIVNPEDSVQQVARSMREADTGALPVGEGDRLVGMVTDRDLAVRLVAERRDPARTKVREVISSEVRYVFEDEALEHVAENMVEQQVRRLPVMNRCLSRRHCEGTSVTSGRPSIERHRPARQPFLTG